MKILVDEEGKKTVLSLVDAAVRSGGFPSAQQVFAVVSAIQLIDPPYRPKADEKPSAEAPKC